jgi:hypothetical protein
LRRGTNSIEILTVLAGSAAEWLRIVYYYTIRLLLRTIIEEMESTYGTATEIKITTAE